MSSLVTRNFHENNLYTLFDKNVYAFSRLWKGKKGRISSGMETVPVLRRG